MTVEASDRTGEGGCEGARGYGSVVEAGLWCLTSSDEGEGVSVAGDKGETGEGDRKGEFTCGADGARERAGRVTGGSERNSECTTEERRSIHQSGVS